jgi:tRNA G18 (ribose-2'-O)-methylase SpoU
MVLQTECITDLTLPELDCYARLREPQLYHLFEPEAGAFIAESPVVIERALEAGFRPLSFLLEEGQLPVLEQLSAQFPSSGADRDERIPVYVSDMDTLSGITGYRLTRGMLCAMRRRPLPDAGQLCAEAERILVLEEVVNPTNVGAIFRSAAALGMDAVLLTKGCSDPLYRRCIRVSMGTVFQIPWTFFGEDCKWPEKGMELLRRHGFKTVAMALREDAAALDDPGLNAEKKLAVIMGTEGDGLKDRTIADCDYTVRIAMAHGVDSLNVAAASAVACYQLGRR